MTSELCYLSGAEVLDRFRSKTLSPTDYMKAIIARCEVVNPKVNAFTNTYFDRALAAASVAEEHYRSGAARPLEGLPIVIKDTHPVKDEISTSGSRLLADFRPSYTAPAIQRLLDAGAIMHARSNSPEFAHAGYCYNTLWGVTRNPWNLDYSPGGSSGGAAAALASGMTPLADGTDGGGSIRIPASASGIVGYKPPFGRNPLKMLPTAFELLIMIGPMARTVEDVRLMQNVMAGPHLDDITSLHPKLEIPPPKGITGWKIAYSPDLGYVEIDPEVRRNAEACVAAFRSCGCEVDEVEVDWDWSALDAWQTHWEVLSAVLLGDVVGRGRYEEMHPFLVKTIRTGQTHGAAAFRKTEFVRTQMWEKLAPIMAKYNVLICPTLAIPSVKAEHDPEDKDFRINGRRIDPYVGWYLTYQFNILSQLPVISVPSGVATTGVPTGLQIVGRPYDDVSVFEAAFAFEKARSWHDRHPAL
jgi:Asp-tRNA(Asn)/Glu-tRNA(Gln) amidotransferase A subunit family amidase